MRVSWCTDDVDENAMVSVVRSAHPFSLACWYTSTRIEQFAVRRDGLVGELLLDLLPDLVAGFMVAHYVL